jgi:hypothetical protein
MEVVRKFRDLKGEPAFQDSIFLDVSRSSPGALVLSGPVVESRHSEDVFLNKGAEVDGEVSPDALPMPA